MRRKPHESTFTSRVEVKGGAYTDLADLIRLRYAARELSQYAGSKTRNPLSGLLTSHFRGRGIDFAEVRAYQPGDDIRTIDWRVTARTDTPHTKLFQEEKERPVLILVDQSQSMFFGSRVAFKSVLAAETAALLAWAALERGDRTGGIVFSERGHRDVRPRRSKHSVLRLLNEINDFNHALSRDMSQAPSSAAVSDDPSVNQAGTPASVPGNRYLADALRNVRRVARHGSTIFIISDFQDFSEEAGVHLNQLARHNSIVGFHIADIMEKELPQPDVYTITNGADRVRINTGNRGYRNRYEADFAAHLEATRTSFARLKVPLIELMTHEPVTASVVNKYNAWVAQVS